jgi:hypothetical protein
MEGPGSPRVMAMLHSKHSENEQRGYGTAESGALLTLLHHSVHINRLRWVFDRGMPPGYLFGEPVWQDY